MWLTRKLKKKSTVNHFSPAHSPTTAILSPSLQDLSRDESAVKTQSYIEVQFITVRNLDNSNHRQNVTFQGRYMNIKTHSERVKTCTVSASYPSCSSYLTSPTSPSSATSLSSREHSGEFEDWVTNYNNCNNLDAMETVYCWDKEHYLIKVERRESFTSSGSKTKSVRERFAFHKRVNSFQLTRHDTLLEFELWDSDKKKNHYVGSAYLNLEQLPTGRFVLVEEPLCGTNEILSCFVKAHNYGSKVVSSFNHEQKNKRYMIGYNPKYDVYYDSLSIHPQLSSMYDRKSQSDPMHNNKQQTSSNSSNKKLRVKLEHALQSPELVDIMLPILSESEKMEEVLMSGWVSRLKFPINESELEEFGGDSAGFDTISIKVAITHTPNDDSVKQSSRTGCFPVQNLSNIPSSCNIGLFQCGLIIGPHIIDWNRSAICQPRPALSADVLIVFEIANIRSLDVLNHIMRSCSKTLVKWNTSYSFSELGHKLKTGNSFTFVRDVLRNMGMPLEGTGPIFQFISSMEMGGTGKMKLLMDQDFKDRLILDFESIVFETHQELDQFIKDVRNRDPEWEAKWPEVSQLLRTFDQFFWMQNHRTRSIIKGIKDKTDILTTKQVQASRIEAVQKEKARFEDVLFDTESDHQDCPFGTEAHMISTSN